MILLDTAAPLVLLRSKQFALSFLSAAESQYSPCIAAEAEYSWDNS